MASGKKNEGGAPTVDSKRFIDLNKRFPLRPIRDDKQLATANRIIESLLARESLDPAEDDYLDVLGDLVFKYENEEHPLRKVPGEDVLRHILEARELSQAALARGANIAEPTVSAILAGRRMLNRSHIDAIATFLRVDPAMFIPA